MSWLGRLQTQSTLELQPAPYARTLHSSLCTAMCSAPNNQCLLASGIDLATHFQQIRYEACPLHAELSTHGAWLAYPFPLELSGNHSRENAHMKNSDGRLPSRITPPRRSDYRITALHGLSHCPRITTSADVATAFGPVVESDQEIFIAGLLDSRSKLVAWQIVSVGSEKRFSARVADLFSLVMGKDRHRVLFAYNGNGKAPVRDLEFAEDILGAAAILGVEVFDFVRVTSKGHQSLVIGNRGQSKTSRRHSSLVACA